MLLNEGGTNLITQRLSLQDEIVVNTCKSWREIDLGAMKQISKATFILHAKHEDEAGTINCSEANMRSIFLYLYQSMKPRSRATEPPSSSRARSETNSKPIYERNIPIKLIAYNLVEMCVYQNREESFLNAFFVSHQSVFRDDSHC